MCIIVAWHIVCSHKMKILYYFLFVLVKKILILFLLRIVILIHSVLLPPFFFSSLLILIFLLPGCSNHLFNLLSFFPLMVTASLFSTFLPPSFNILLLSFKHSCTPPELSLDWRPLIMAQSHASVSYYLKTDYKNVTALLSPMHLHKGLILSDQQGFW